MQVSPSNALPFLEKPPALDGSLAGDAGFDPVGFSANYDMNWLREAELKNGRVAMLGVVGLLTPEFFHLPMFTAGVTPYDSVYTVSSGCFALRPHSPCERVSHAAPMSIRALYTLLQFFGNVRINAVPLDCASPFLTNLDLVQVPGVGLVQILLGVGALEYKMHGGKIAKENMFADGRKPGDFGFDPMGMGKKNLPVMQLREIKNGRLAMLAFGGIIHQQLLSGVPTIAFFKVFKPVSFNLQGKIA